MVVADCAAIHLQLDCTFCWHSAGPASRWSCYIFQWRWRPEKYFLLPNPVSDLNRCTGYVGKEKWQAILLPLSESWSQQCVTQVDGSTTLTDFYSIWRYLSGIREGAYLSRTVAIQQNYDNMCIPAVKSSAILLVAFCNWECFPRRESACVFVLCSN